MAVAFFDKRKVLSADGLVLTNPLGNLIVERSCRQSYGLPSITGLGQAEVVSATPWR
jgi:hypothetical protein